MKKILGAFCVSMISICAQANNSVYTSLEDKSCKMLESSADNSTAEIDYFTMSFPGRDGYEIKVAGADSRSWLVVTKSGHEIYNSMNDINAESGGYFANVAGKVLEWRYDDAKNLVALIVRISAQDSDNPNKSFSKLFVFRYESGRFCYLNTHKTNQGAHHIADSTGSCRI